MEILTTGKDKEGSEEVKMSLKMMSSVVACGQL
jgi:hypothetical protein